MKLSFIDTSGKMVKLTLASVYFMDFKETQFMKTRSIHVAAWVNFQMPTKYPLLLSVKITNGSVSKGKCWIVDVKVFYNQCKQCSVRE